MTDRSPATRQLADTLGVPEERLSSVRSLRDADLGRLDELVRSAVLRDAAAIDRGMERTLRFLPRPLRGRARKMLLVDDA